MVHDTDNLTEIIECTSLVTQQIESPTWSFIDIRIGRSGFS